MGAKAGMIMEGESGSPWGGGGLLTPTTVARQTSPSGLQSGGKSEGVAVAIAVRQ